MSHQPEFTAELIPFPGQPQPEYVADQSIVECLERLLTMAKHGEITGFAYAAVMANSQTQTHLITDGYHLHSMCAATEIVHENALVRLMNTGK